MFSIGGKGHVTFASVSSPLTINSQAYMLVNSVTALATAATSNPTGLFALAESDDASQDGVFAGSPINSFSGTFDGLGNSITRLHIGFSSGHNNVTGLFGQIDSATIQHVHLIKIDIHEKQSNVGGLVGVSYRSFLYQDSVAGSITATNFSYVGGLVGQNNLSLLSESFADVAISAGSESVAGGLAGANIGSVVSNSYATGSIAGTPASVGGLIGAVDCACCGHCSQVSTSYSTGAVSAQPGGALGGLIGTLSQTVVSNNYWDTTTSGTDNGVGSGNAESITGLTTAQLRSGLPVGFDPAIWTESPIINDGLPYLIDNPPP
ncbi:MAG: hypothetical protein M3T55_01820 [Pseudomonadota bacterium]|nr:hypothetical protein [Pseudomonadota bacterium]